MSAYDASRNICDASVVLVRTAGTAPFSRLESQEENWYAIVVKRSLRTERQRR
jgi:hypothetical protein